MTHKPGWLEQRNYGPVVSVFQGKLIKLRLLRRIYFFWFLSLVWFGVRQQGRVAL